MSPPTPLFAPRKVNCKVCRIGESQWAEVNAAMWEGGHRRRDYIACAQRVIAANGMSVDDRTIQRHAEHIEATWHRGNPTTREDPVFPIDYDSMTDRAARLGGKAMGRIEEKLDAGEPLDTKDLVMIAKAGLGAAQHRAAMQAKDRRQGEVLDVLLLMASGNAPALPEGEVIDVTPASELRAEFERERALLEARSRGAS